MSRNRRAALAVVAVAAFTAGSAQAAEAKTLRLYERNVTQALYHADGTPVTNPTAPPVVGDRYVFVSRLYAGTRKKHGKKVIGYDHVVCTIAVLPSGPNDTGGSVLCDASLYVRGGMIYINRTPVPSGDRFTIKVSGVGTFKRAKTLTQTASGDNWANLVISY